MRNDQQTCNEVLANNDDDMSSVEMSCSETETKHKDEGLPDFPAFSPEGMISWMFERCYRRRRFNFQWKQFQSACIHRAHDAVDAVGRSV